MIEPQEEQRMMASSLISDGIFLCPLLADPLCILLVLLVMFCDIGGKRVVRVWGAKQGLYR
jgi:hypothetical protein